jgi:hypothetical protein
MSLIVNKRRFWVCVGTGAVFAAVMLNPSCLVFAPFAWLVQHPDASWRSRRPWLAVVAVVTSYVVEGALARRIDYVADAEYDDFSLTDMFRNVDVVLSNIWRELLPLATPLLLTMSIVWLIVRSERFSLRLKLAYAGAPAFALVWAFTFSGNAWVELNLLLPRYFFPVHAVGILLLTAAVTEGIAAIPRVGWIVDAHVPTGGPRTATAIVAVGLALCSLAAVWGIRRVDIDVVEAARPSVDAAARFDAPVIVGDYWQTWPAVVDARSRGLDVNGLAPRVEPILNDVVADLDRRTESGTPMAIVCTSHDVDDCVDLLEGWTRRPWEVAAVLAARPLVLSVQPVR